MTQQKVNYIDKEVLYDDLCKWKVRKDEAERLGKRPPPLPDSIGRAIVQIADNMARRPNFRNYTYIEEMRGDAIVGMVKAANSFDPERVSKKTGQKNPFGFLSLVCWRNFIGRIKDEKAEHAGKMKALLDPTTEHFTQGEDDYDIDTSGMNQFLYENRA